MTTNQIITDFINSTFIQEKNQLFLQPVNDQKEAKARLEIVQKILSFMGTSLAAQGEKVSQRQFDAYKLFEALLLTQTAPYEIIINKNSPQNRHYWIRTQLISQMITKHFNAVIEHSAAKEEQAVFDSIKAFDQSYSQLEELEKETIDEIQIFEALSSIASEIKAECDQNPSSATFFGEKIDFTEEPVAHVINTLAPRTGVLVDDLLQLFEGKFELSRLMELEFEKRTTDRVTALLLLRIAESESAGEVELIELFSALENRERLSHTYSTLQNRSFFEIKLMIGLLIVRDLPEDMIHPLLELPKVPEMLAQLDEISAWISKEVELTPHSFELANFPFSYNASNIPR